MIVWRVAINAGLRNYSDVAWFHPKWCLGNPLQMALFE